MAALRGAGETVVSQVEEGGLLRWIETVRRHHSQTYQHCLLVTGIAISFAQHLGFRADDKRKLALAGLLHDLGKAKIPVTMLEKPGPLDKEETLIMRQHAQLGFESLRRVEGCDPDMLDMILHHHEYLDGSGYPHGIQANELSDLTRMMTIADVFGALIEHRPYRASLSQESAFEILEKMGPRLDKDLLRAFRPVAQVGLAPRG